MTWIKANMRQPALIFLWLAAAGPKALDAQTAEGERIHPPQRYDAKCTPILAGRV